VVKGSEGTCSIAVPFERKRMRCIGDGGEEKTHRYTSDTLDLAGSPRGLLPGDGRLLVHGRDDGDEDVLAIFERSRDLVADGILGNFDVILGDTFAVHQVEEPIVDVDLQETSVRIVDDAQGEAKDVRVGIRYVGHWEHPCCGWRGRYPPVDGAHDNRCEIRPSDTHRLPKDHSRVFCR
jgi:hypothetical protein